MSNGSNSSTTSNDLKIDANLIKAEREIGECLDHLIAEDKGIFGFKGLFRNPINEELHEAFKKLKERYRSLVSLVNTDVASLKTELHKKNLELGEKVSVINRHNLNAIKTLEAYTKLLHGSSETNNEDKRRSSSFLGRKSSSRSSDKHQNSMTYSREDLIRILETVTPMVAHQQQKSSKVVINHTSNGGVSVNVGEGMSSKAMDMIGSAVLTNPGLAANLVKGMIGSQKNAGKRDRK